MLLQNLSELLDVIYKEGKMDNKVTLYFTLGGIVGGFIGWFVTKSYYKKEISEIREAHAQMDKKNTEEASEATDETPVEDKDIKQDLHEYAELLRSQGYGGKAVREEKKVEAKLPYTIAPDEFGEDPDNYECLTFSYYADGVLADDADDPITNVQEIIGDALNHIGEYEPDAVYVRNELLGTEYEILRDPRKYSEEVEPTKSKPPVIQHEDDD